MFVAVSLESMPDLSIEDAVEIADDLEFAAVEIDLHEDGGHVRPSEVLTNPDTAYHRVRLSHRLDIASFSVRLLSTGDEHYEQFAELCKFAKLCKVVTLTVPSAELGTPFNEEVEHLQRLVDIAETEGCRVAVRTQIGRLSEDPDTLMVLCDNVHGLGITLDPSVFMCGPCSNKSLDRIMKYVFHVHLRDSKPDAFQVSVGQGDLDYAKLIGQLSHEKYDRAFSIHMSPIDGLDHRVELRKLRRLTESLL
ncbi:Xylose isomerase-like TIM barrel [Rosistilla oblonga]|nr:sugar phosphate isomerase/epimerase [Rosistilla oblonga]QDV13890.1 Xylose isomerase-like TIM barrel [Rosistilla oblonga]